MLSVKEKQTQEIDHKYSEMQSSLLWNAPFFALSIFAALFFAQSAPSFALTALFFPQAERHLIRTSYTYIWMHSWLHCTQIHI